MARQNKRGLKLSFKKCSGSRGRWYTQIGGTPKYFGYGSGVSDRASYEAALSAYAVWQGEQAAQSIAESRGSEPTQLARSGMSWRQFDAGNREYVATIAEARQTVVSRGSVSALLDEFVAEQKSRNAARHFVETQKSAGVAIDESRNANISDARLASIIADVETFRAVVGSEQWDGSESVATSVLKKFVESQKALLFSQSIKANTFDQKIKLARQFAGWCEANYKLDRMPRNAKAIFAKYGGKTTNAKAIPLPTLRKLWKFADDRERAFIAMGLNLGYYSKDISDLTAEQIEGGYVSHVRGKTGVKVKYKLWAITAKLISMTRTNQSGRVYLNHNEKPLNYYSTNDSGKMIKTDIVRNDFYRLCEKCEVKGFSFSNLRDTSSTHVENFDSSLTDLFDCHSDKRMARFYVDGEMVDTSALDGAIDHLEALYGLTLDREASATIRRTRGKGKAKKQTSAAAVAA